MAPNDKDITSKDSGTGEQEHRTYEDWCKTLEGKSDEDASRQLFDTIMNKGNLPEETGKLFKDIFDYSIQKIHDNKTFDIDLLKIYLKDIKGYDKIETTNLYPILLLLSMCGINWFVVDT